ncbi:MAG: hypothetical protein H8E66_31605 [Planctomycetes bacterium]|nr:hypothetical protein [Planctomycetota bacterium]
MHSHERTMLAKLGFADPDRREPLHDVACHYLVTPDAVRRLIRCLAIEHGPEPYADNSGDEERTSQFLRKVASHRVTRECEIAKGWGQYRTTVGFADLVLQLHIEEHHREAQKRTRNVPDGRGNLTWTEWHPVADFVWQSNEEVGVEVKVTPVAVSDVVRQVKLYRSYSGIRTWVVATTYQITRADLECLRNERFQHVYLGEHFQAFVAEQPTSDPAVSMEV